MWGSGRLHCFLQEKMGCLRKRAGRLVLLTWIRQKKRLRGFRLLCNEDEHTCWRFAWPSAHVATSAYCVRHSFFVLPCGKHLRSRRQKQCNGIYCPDTVTAQRAAALTAVCWQFENVTAYLSSWVGWEEPDNLSQRLEWSYLCCVSYWGSLSNSVACRAWHQHSEHGCIETTHGGKFPVHSQGSSKKLFCKRLLFVEMLHFMSDNMNLKEMNLKAHPRRHVRHTGI